MTGNVVRIWRHPIKSHGREALDTVELSVGQTLPWDRRWAVAHDAAKLPENGGWAPCTNFSRGAKAPGLMAIEARLNETAGTVSLTHPDRPELRFAPDTEAAAFLDWVRPLMPADRAASTRIVRLAAGRGVTDTAFPSVSLNNLASHREVEQKLGRRLSPKRWRGNFWFDGLGAWEEFEWLGREVRIGEATLAVRERIVRCLATTANPDTGERDADTLGTLEAGWGHREFGVYAEVTGAGRVRTGDPVEVL